MAVSAPSFFLSRIADFSLHPPKPPPPRFLIPPPSFSSAAAPRRSSSPPTSLSCLMSGFDGGGVSDEFVSTRKSTYDRGFAVIANMLKRIEPLDTSVISRGVSDLAKDSMKQTISTMLGLLPSDQFSVTVTVAKHPLDRLMFSSIITGYTLWSAEYRMSLVRNLDVSPSVKKESACPTQTEVSGDLNGEDKNIEIGSDVVLNGLESCSPRVFGDLSPEALNYIQQLQSELTRVKEVTELARPSAGVEDIVHQLVQNISRRFIGDNANFKLVELSVERNIDDHSNDDKRLCDTVGTSRDYLAKLLFWCMLLGHHLRGLENRLYLSCAVGLL
ncbi:uncharacterized protein LOC129306141 isoform X2 [Prosopis cineraria]|uniref:uncharacterized protein LOC129306141 isoform X2 n=1 Tax=Prosopis cineraria TaxID=364024 RepID=UPI00240EF05B|nr:uncharacterized protein LOC129306141 isoform X2 [Prosopis cineraria]